MGMIQEFKEFALRGNVVDMAVGVVIGAAFGKIVTSLTNDLLLPPIGVMTGGMDFSKLSIPLKPATDAAPAVAINYGAFINVVIDFAIIAFVIFLLVKAMNSMKKQAAPPGPPGPTREEVLLTEIRDALRR